MTQGQQDAFRQLLAIEADKERSLVRELRRNDALAVQTLELSRVQYRRAVREVPEAAKAGDFDEPYVSLYKALINGCNALLAGFGYRVHGGDGAHELVLRLAQTGLHIFDENASAILNRIQAPVRAARNEAEYQRPGVTTARDLRELFEGVAVILPSLHQSVKTLINKPELPLEDVWEVPRL